MAYTLIQTINWSQTFYQYSPVTAGLGQEPAVSTASMIRSTIMSAPFCWAWNRNENSAIVTTPGVQDYILTNLNDFGFLEKCSLQDSTGKIFEIKDVYNTASLSVATAPLSRPNAIAVITRSFDSFGSIKFRFMGVPDAVYTVTLTYQKLCPIMGPFLITSANAASLGNTTYFGQFDPDTFPVGSTAQVTGFGTGPVFSSVNNGSFTVVSVEPSMMVLANPNGVALTQTAYVSNFNWAPIPDNYNYIYDTLFLGEMMAMVDDARAAQYRQRGIASLLAKAEGLSEMQRDAFMQQWLARGVEMTGVAMRAQQGIQGRAV